MAVINEVREGRGCSPGSWSRVEEGGPLGSSQLCKEVIAGFSHGYRPRPGPQPLLISRGRLCHQAHGAVSTARAGCRTGALLGSGVWRPGLRPTSPQCPGHPATEKELAPVSPVSIGLPSFSLQVSLGCFPPRRGCCEGVYRAGGAAAWMVCGGHFDLDPFSPLCLLQNPDNQIVQTSKEMRTSNHCPTVSAPPTPLLWAHV